MSNGATCTVCNHKDVTLINDTLTRVSQRRTAVMFGLKHDAVRRHVISQHPGVIVAGQEDGPALPEGASARDQLEAIAALLRKRLAAGTIREGEMRELRLTIDAIEKAGGGPAPEVTRVQDIEGYAELEAEEMEALEPYPEARKALAAVLRKRMERRA